MCECEGKPAVESEWERFDRGIVQPGGRLSPVMTDPVYAARLAFVCGFQAACLVTRERCGDVDGRVWDEACKAFDAEREKWAERILSSRIENDSEESTSCSF